MAIQDFKGESKAQGQVIFIPHIKALGGRYIMQKVKEVAEELGVTSQTIYNHIQKLDQDLKPHLFKREGATVIDAAGVEMIRQSVEGGEGLEGGLKDDPDPQGENPAVEELLEHYKGLIETLKGQLAEKDRQLERKDEHLRNFQVLMRQTQERVLELEGEVEEGRRSLWERVKWW